MYALVCVILSTRETGLTRRVRDSRYEIWRCASSPMLSIALPPSATQQEGKGTHGDPRNGTNTNQGSAGLLAGTHASTNDGFMRAIVATNWPLADWTAQALISIGSQEPTRAHSHEVEIEDISDDDDWQSDNLSTNVLAQRRRTEVAKPSLPRSILLHTLHSHPHAHALHSINGLSLRMLSLAGFNSTSSPSSLPIPSRWTHHRCCPFSPNYPISNTLSLAGSYLPPLLLQ